MEGTVASVPPQGGESILNKNFTSGHNKYSFICRAFAGLDKLIDSRGTAQSVLEQVKNYKEQPLSEIMKMLEPEDLIKYGLIPEFIGRMRLSLL